MNYNRTLRSCFVAYIVQAIVNNFAPLLFLMFQKSYDIPLAQITTLITINFGLQLLIDLASVKFVDKIGYRTSMVLAHFFAAAGLILMTILPDIMPSAFSGLLVSVMIYAVGGGLLEVIVSPVVEACPTDNKEMAMSMLHSFYCWGCVGVIGLSSLFFTVFGIGNWKIIALIWAAIPIVNGLIFTRIPIAHLDDGGGNGLNLKQLFSNKIFWVMFLLMVCAGASEISISQWASTFAEKGLGVSKALGDLAGPALFAVFMGIARTIYGKLGDRIQLDKFMGFSAVLCVASYLMMSLSGNPVIGFIGCALCGFSVGIMWPGTFSIAAASIKGGGTAMFALLALAGDLGASGGPTFVGMVSSAFSDNLKAGILAAIIFPILLIIGLVIKRRMMATDSTN